MIKLHVSALLFITSAAGIAQSRQFRFFLSYGDEQLVRLARESGADVSAAIGSEIPSSVPLAVPTRMQFKVQLRVEHDSQGFGDVFLHRIRSFIAYDRAQAFNLFDEACIAPDAFSFQKLSPVYTGFQQIRYNASNFASRTAYDLDHNSIDRDGDGIPDLAALDSGTAGCTGAYVPGQDDQFIVRPIGTSYGLSPGYWTSEGLVPAWFRMLPGERMHIFDLIYSNTLAVGETYGYRSGETGLLLHTTGGEQNGGANNMGMRRISVLNPEPWQNIGAKYNLIGAAPVPEPGSAVALALGAAALLRRRR